nr:hypothetical protein BgiMline_020532 [Biomphalaria glabrata]
MPSSYQDKDNKPNSLMGVIDPGREVHGESGAEKIIWSLEQRRSYGVWSRKDHMESGAEKIIWSLEQIRSYGVWSREDHMESGADKIIWSLEQRRSYGVWSIKIIKST